MRRTEATVARDRENADPKELNKPVPKAFVVLVFVLLGWAVYYIAKQSPGLESSSAGSAPSAAGAEKR
jgi:hypothetical protein